MLNIGKRKWASSFCLASSFGGAFFGAPSNNVAADDEFLKSDLLKILVSTVFKYKVDHFYNNNKSMDSIIEANLKAELSAESAVESAFVDAFFASAFKKTYEKDSKNKYFGNIFFDKNKDNLEKTKILSLDEKYPWEKNLGSLSNKIEELKSQGLDTLIYWYAISDFKETCAKVRNKILLERLKDSQISTKNWLAFNLVNTDNVATHARGLKVVIEFILKGNIDSKIVDFLRTRTYKDMFLNSKGEYNQEKFGAYMKYIGEFCGRIKNGEFDENLSVDEKDNLLFCEGLANTFLKIISISHNKMPKNKQDNRFKSESPLALGLLSNSEKETLIFDILKCSEIFIGRKFLTKDYIAKAIEEIAKSFDLEDSKKIFFKIAYILWSTVSEHISNNKDTLSLFNILIENLKGEKQKKVILSITNKLNHYPKKKAMYLSEFLLNAIKELSKEQREDLFKWILSEPSIFSSGENSKKELVFSILKSLVRNFSEEEKRNFFFYIAEHANELLKKNNKGEYVEAGCILNALKVLIGQNAVNAIIDSFFLLAGEDSQITSKDSQKFCFKESGTSKLFISTDDEAIKFLEKNINAIRKFFNGSVSDYIMFSSGIDFEKK